MQKQPSLARYPGSASSTLKSSNARYSAASSVSLVTALLVCGCSSNDGDGQGAFADSMGTSSGAQSEGTESAGRDSGSDSMSDGSDEQSDGVPSGTQDDGDAESKGSSNQGNDTQSEPDQSSEDEGGVWDVTVSDIEIEGDEEIRSYIWIANSSENTVSKINTQTMIEEGRYQTRPDGLGNPSRTSVNLSGDSAVANRSGGITKYYASIKDCEDKNGNGNIRTSRSSRFLDWDEEECVAWHVPMDYDSQRALAWTSGILDPDTGERSNEELWVTGYPGSNGGLDIRLLNGEDGSEVGHVEEMRVGSKYGANNTAYGGAIDPDNNFWYSNVEYGSITRVRHDDFVVEHWEKPRNSYGITVDGKGRVWTCQVAVARFDPTTETWEVADPSFGHDKIPDTSGGNSHFTGCMADQKGRLWKFALLLGDDGLHYPAIVGIDGESLLATELIKLPSIIKGVSIDFEGHVWGVVGQGSDAYRINPDTRTFETFTGLVGAYTYSDMTGFQLASVAGPVD